jgi:hypothetical protein
LADGGGGFCLSRKAADARCLVRIPFYRSSAAEGGIKALINALGGAQTLNGKYALLLAGIPAAVREEGEGQLAEFLTQSGLRAPIIRYREFTGEFASASAVAAVMAASFLSSGKVPGPFVSGNALGLKGSNQAILVLGLGRYLSAMEFSRP